MSRWKLVVGMAMGLALFGCEKKPPEKPEKPDKPEKPEKVEAPDEALENAKALVAEGEDLLAKKDLAGARKKAEEAEALKPGLDETKALLDKVKAEEGKVVEISPAEQAKKKAAELRKRAKALLAQGNLDEALASAKEAQKLQDTAESGQLVEKIENELTKKAARDQRDKAKKQIRDRALRAQGERKWETAAKLLAQAAELASNKAERTGFLKQATHCMAMGSYERGQKEEKAGRLAAARDCYAEALKGEPRNRRFRDASVKVAGKIRAADLRKKDVARCAELLAGAKTLVAAGKLDEAQAVLRGAAGIARADEKQLAEVASMQAEVARKRMEREYEKHVAAAGEAFDAEPPDYARAAEEFVIIKRIGEFPPELQEKLVECRFQLAAQNGDAAVEAGNFAEAIDYYEESLSYKDDEAVHAKLEQVKDSKAADDFDALVAKGAEAMGQGREEEAVDAYDLAVKLADQRPGAFEGKAKDVAGAKTKYNKAKAARAKKLNAELAGKWKELLGKKKALKGDPRAAKEMLVAEQETFEGSKYAAMLAKSLGKTQVLIDKALKKEWAKLRKQVARSEDREQNIQLLTEFLEKARGTKYAQPVQDQLDAEKQALEEAPPEEPVEPEPVEGAAPPEAPPEPVEELPVDE